jgi:hypothetical protein
VLCSPVHLLHILWFRKGTKSHAHTRARHSNAYEYPLIQFGAAHYVHIIFFFLVHCYETHATVLVCVLHIIFYIVNSTNISHFSWCADRRRCA